MARRGVKLKRGNNRELKAVCPFHKEKTPSFWVEPKEKQYYCFGCGAKGDVITFIEDFDDLRFNEAVRVLAAESGVSLDVPNFAEYVKLSMERKRDLLPEVKPLAFPGKRSTRPDLPDSVWEEFSRSCGTVIQPIPWPESCFYLGDPRIPSVNSYAASRLPLDLLQSLGAMGCLSGRYRGRLILPVFRDGQLVFYQARDALGRCDINKEVPKYTGPPGQSSGRHLAFLEEASRSPELLLCEGWLSAAAVGRDAVASFTCNLTDEQVTLLKLAGVRKLCLCFDPDAWTTPPAQARMRERKPPVYRALMKLVNAGFDRVRVARLIGGDPYDLSRTATFRRLVSVAPVVQDELDVASLFM